MESMPKTVTGTHMQTLGLDDVRILCRGQVFSTHSLILATASKHLLNVLMAEGCNEQIAMVIEDSEPCEVQYMLDYLHKGEVIMNPKNYPGFMRLAKFLRIDSLNYDLEQFTNPGSEMNEIRICRKVVSGGSNEDLKPACSTLIQKKIPHVHNLARLLEQGGSPILRVHADQEERLPPGLTVEEMIVALKLPKSAPVEQMSHGKKEKQGKKNNAFTMARNT